jgi:polysaccharide export outer membrane protein
MAEVNVRDVVDLRNPSANIAVRPHDEISVSRAQILYVIGNVRKPGGFALSQSHALTALEALSLAEGLSPNASAGDARILRRTGTGEASREHVPINLKKILAGKEEDVRLHPDDILFVPDNSSRRITIRAAETALQTVSGLIIWRGF